MTWYEEPFWWICKSEYFNYSVSHPLLNCFFMIAEQWSITWLPASFIFPLWFSWSALLTISPVCAFMVAVNNSGQGCNRPSGINFDLENMSWHEWVPSFSEILRILPQMLVFDLHQQHQLFECLDWLHLLGLLLFEI